MTAVANLDSRNPLDELESVVARLLDRHLATAKEWFPHDYVPWDLGRSFADAPWQPSERWK